LFSFSFSSLCFLELWNFDGMNDKGFFMTSWFRLGPERAKDPIMIRWVFYYYYGRTKVQKKEKEKKEIDHITHQ